MAFYLADILTFYLAIFLAVEVQQCPLLSGGPRLRSSTAHWYREIVVDMFRSSGAHWDWELAVEVQQCPLRSGAGKEARRRGGEEEEKGGGVESYLKI